MSFEQTTNGERLVNQTDEFHVKLLIEKTIPIYTFKNPDENGKTDCQRVRVFKDGLRYMMKQKIDEIIRYYDAKAKDGHQ
jgi:hypothetical protein